MELFNYSIEEEGLSVEKLLRDRWRLGRKTVHELRMADAVKLPDGGRVRWNELLPAGTALSIRLPEAVSDYVPEMGELDVIHEDPHCLVVHKPASLAVHPNDSGGTGTLMNRVIARFGPYVEHVHRLDKGTSGLVLIARHPVAKAVFDRMLEEKAIRRTYMAETPGPFNKRSGTISAPIGRDRHHATRRRVSPSGQQAVTHYEVISAKDGTSIVQLELDTGRTHQIRVHLAHLGHPIIGDVLYGGHTAGGWYRLHAARLAFIHPFTGKPLDIEDTVKPEWLP
ncbi:RNA pseudouridine synthase [Bhargavaea cecembensis]|uniref:Pseudouridine synthase n=1 Tax=Bhargavaea cecembensis TaxID=394098 RepID=A0A163EE21_9BACL|nr:RluA family pseudouridine synthase [Bhargavaea cecembensis]KZE36327.1 RNA pseudouridine synthase [Bhargavaea cecembensis]